MLYWKNEPTIESVNHTEQLHEHKVNFFVERCIFSFKKIEIKVKKSAKIRTKCEIETFEKNLNFKN